MSEEVQVKRYILLDKTPEEVWQLITEPGNISKWFCDNAEVDLKAAGDFKFSGSCVLGEGLKILNLAAPESITFSWNILGSTTEVEWKLDRHLDMTRLIATHTASTTPEVEFSAVCGSTDYNNKRRVNLDDLWWNAFGRLKYFVETGKESPKPNLHVDASNAVTQEVEIPLNLADKAFAALTVPKHMDQWLSTNAEVELKEGGQFSYGWGDGPGKVTDYIPNQKIAYTWNYSTEPETNVSWEVKTEGAQAKIKLVHSGFGDLASAFHDYNQGWAGFFIRLSIYLETGISVHENWYGDPSKTA